MLMINTKNICTCFTSMLYWIYNMLTTNIVWWYTPIYVHTFTLHHFTQEKILKEKKKKTWQSVQAFLLFRRMINSFTLHPPETNYYWSLHIFYLDHVTNLILRTNQIIHLLTIRMDIRKWSKEEEALLHFERSKVIFFQTGISIHLISFY